MDLDNEKQLQNKIKQLEKEVARLKKAVKQTKYGLVWMNVPEAFEDDAENKLPLLKEIPEKAIINDDGKPTHILIVGDNYHALTCLNYTHKGKIDVIYIDPPYNTGEDGFRYRDKRILEKFPDGTLVPKDHPLRHSYWLSFMQKRLELMRELLTPQGVAIIHMDENELFNLGLLLCCNKVFSEKNNLGMIIWNKKNPKGDAKKVSIMHEYIFCFAKNKDRFLEFENTLQRKKPNALSILQKARRLYAKLGKKGIPEEVREVIKPFNYPLEIIKDFEVEFNLELINKEFQSWLARQDFSGGEKAYKFIDKDGEVYQSVSMAWPNKQKAPDEYFIPLIHPTTGKKCPVPARGWRNPPVTMQQLFNDKAIIFGDDENTQPRRKYLLRQNLFENTPSIFEYGGSDDDLFAAMGLKFDNPKPVNVAKYLLNSIHPQPRVILDFFAGSGTAAHAAIELNSNGNQFTQCILVTNNENNICTEVCYPRVRNVISGYKSKVNGERIPSQGNSLKYYTTAFIGKNNALKATDEDKIELAHQAGDLLALAENTLYKVKENKFWQVYENSERYTSIYFREELDKFDEFVSMMEKLKYPATVYVFSWGDDEFAEEFEHIDGIKVKAIPLPILEIYKNIYNMG